MVLHRAALPHSTNKCKHRLCRTARTSEEHIALELESDIQFELFRGERKRAHERVSGVLDVVIASVPQGGAVVGKPGNELPELGRRFRADLSLTSISHQM